MNYSALTDAVVHLDLKMFKGLFTNKIKLIVNPCRTSIVLNNQIHHFFFFSRHTYVF